MIVGIEEEEEEVEEEEVAGGGGGEVCLLKAGFWGMEGSIVKDGIKSACVSAQMSHFCAIFCFFFSLSIQCTSYSCVREDEAPLGLHRLTESSRE